MVVPANFRGKFSVAFIGFGVRHGEIFNAKAQGSKGGKMVKSVFAKDWVRQGRARRTCIPNAPNE
jgi:hypothetical protein